MNYIIRVDDRLVHGQVIEGWIKPLKISLIIICSNTVACDIMQKTLFNLSVPPHVKLECETIKETALDIVNNKYEKENVLVLIASLKDLDDFIDEVLNLSKTFVLNNILSKFDLSEIRLEAVIKNTVAVKFWKSLGFKPYKFIMKKTEGF
jgi:PTS system mannose-specific IIB component